MPNVNPHIHFNGNTEEAFEFYKSVLGGTFSKIRRFRDLSDLENTFPEEELNKVMHIALLKGSTPLLTGSDVPNVLGRVNESENRSKITVTADSLEQADFIFKGLSDGGAVEYPMGNSPWGSYFGSFRDKYGIEWLIEFTPD